MQQFTKPNVIANFIDIEQDFIKPLNILMPDKLEMDIFVSLKLGLDSESNDL